MKHIKRFNESESHTGSPIKTWRVIDLLDLVKEISGGEEKHTVRKEWEYYIKERARRNDIGVLEWLDNENIPIITEYLIDKYGFEKSDKVMFWVCW